jgi:hypothetical protein
VRLALNTPELLPHDEVILDKNEINTTYFLYYALLLIGLQMNSDSQSTNVTTLGGASMYSNHMR